MRIVLRPRLMPLITLCLALGAPFIVVFINKGNAWGVVLTSVLIVLAVAFLSFMLSATIKMQDDKIRISTLTCNFESPIDSISENVSPKFSYHEDPEYGLKKHVLGSHLSGFHVGWFVLNNDSVGFVCVTRKKRARAIYIGENCFLVLDPSIAKKIVKYGQQPEEDNPKQANPV